MTQNPTRKSRYAAQVLDVMAEHGGTATMRQLEAETGAALSTLVKCCAGLAQQGQLEAVLDKPRGRHSYRIPGSDPVSRLEARVRELEAQVRALGGTV